MVSGLLHVTSKADLFMGCTVIFTGGLLHTGRQ